MTILIERRICLEHDKLNDKIYEHLLDKIKNISLNECTKDYGYILDIKRIVSIKDNYISNVNCENIFIVLFEAENLKPDIGKIFKGEVCMVFPQGIFLNIKNKQKVLIPVANLKNYTFDPIKKIFINKKKIIKEKDEIEVIITGTKYTKQTFSCFGNIIEKEV